MDEDLKIELTTLQGHYHFCKALSLLGEHEMALKANERAQELCKNIFDGFQDLIQQKEYLKKTLEEANGNLFLIARFTLNVAKFMNW